MADAFSLPGPYQQQQNEIARRQKMAEMLQAQAFAPDTAAPSYNGIPVPVSAFSGLAKALAGIGGGYLQNKAIEEQKALGGQYRTETNSLIGQLSGTPAKAGTPEYTYKPEAADIADWEANPANLGKPYPTNDTGMGVQPAIPGTPAVPQTPSQRQQTLMALSNMGGPGGALGQSLLSKDIDRDYNKKAFEDFFGPPTAPTTGTPPSVLADALASTGTPPSAPTGAPTGASIATPATATTPVAPNTAIPTPPAFTVPPIKVNGKVVDQKAVIGLMLQGGTLADIGKMLNTNINEAAKVAVQIRAQDLTQRTAAAALADQAKRFTELTAEQKAQARKDLAEGIAKYGEDYRKIADPDGKIGGIVPPQSASSTELSLVSRQEALRDAAKKDSVLNQTYEVNGSKTQQTLNRIAGLKSLNDSTFSGMGAELRTTLGQIADAFGVKVDQRVVNSELYLASIAELIKERLGSRDYGAGTAISNLDLLAAKKPLPVLSISQAGRLKIMEAMEADLLTMRRDQQAATKYYAEKGNFRGFEYPSVLADERARNKTFNQQDAEIQARQNKVPVSQIIETLEKAGLKFIQSDKP